MLDVPKGIFSVKRVKGVCCIDKNCCFDIRGLKHLMHCVHCSLASRLLACTELKRACGFLDIFTDGG